MPITITGEIAEDTSTTAVISGTTNDTYTSGLLTSADNDWWRVNLTAGLTYDFTLVSATTTPNLDSAYIRLRTGTGEIMDTASKNGIVGTTADTTGTYYISVEDVYSDGLSEGNYTIQARTNDTVVNNSATTSTVTGTGFTNGTLGQSGDADWFRVTLVEGRSYAFGLVGDGSLNSLDAGYLRIRSENGTILDTASKNSSATVNPETSGTYYISIEDVYSDGMAEGNFRIESLMSDGIVNNVSTTSVLALNDTRNSGIQAYYDSDWFRTTMSSGLTFGIKISGDGSTNALSDPNVYLIDGNTAEYVSVNRSTTTTSETIAYTAIASGNYYVEAGNSGETDLGNYILTSIATDTIRNNSATSAVLRDGSANFSKIDVQTDTDWHKFTAVSGRTYTFTLSGNGTASALDTKYLQVLNSTGAQLTSAAAFSSDTSATVTYKATSSGTWFINAGAYYTTESGGYKLSVTSTAARINGTDSADYLIGGDVDNEILAYGGADKAAGGNGDDTIYGGTSGDSLYGGSGYDSLYGESSNDLIYGGSYSDGLSGSTGNDSLYGGTSDDKLYGGDGDDRLYGESGNDSLYGGADEDYLSGSTGNDLLYGGTGSDTFRFAAGSDDDRIKDFTNNVDQIYLVGLTGVTSVAKALAKATEVSGDVLFDFGGSDTLIVENTTKGALENDLLFG